MVPDLMMRVVIALYDGWLVRIAGWREALMQHENYSCQIYSTEIGLQSASSTPAVWAYRLKDVDLYSISV